jgi:fluoride exporter
MNWFVTALCVGAGGALGALCRFVMATGVAGVFGLQGFVGIITVNVVGCFFIGLVFVVLEAVFRRDGKSRLKGTGLEKHLRHVPGLMNEDLTLQAVDLFRSDQRLRFASSFVITGFLGGFTTFSSFCLDTVRLLEEGAIALAVTNVVVSLLLGFIAVAIGMSVARRAVVTWIVPVDGRRKGDSANRP